MFLRFELAYRILEFGQRENVAITNTILEEEIQENTRITQSNRSVASKIHSVLPGTLEPLFYNMVSFSVGLKGICPNTSFSPFM